MRYADELFNSGEDFKSTFWEVEIDGYTESKFRIETASLPFIKFSTEKLPTGEKYFYDIEYPGEFSITIREKSDLSVRKFFKDWQDSFFIDGAFVSQGEGVEIGSNQDNIHKTLTFRLLKHKIVSEKTNVIENKEIKDNILFSQARRTGRNITQLGSEFVPDSISKRYSKSGEKPNLPRKIQRILSGVEVVTVEERVLRTFTCTHTKLLGFDPIEFNYTGGDPLKYSVSLIADYIDEEETL